MTKPDGVKRYRCYYDSWCGSEVGASSAEDEDGDWVMLSDYDRLAEEVGRLKAALESVRDHLVVFKSYGDGVAQAVAYRIADQALTKGDCDE